MKVGMVVAGLGRVGVGGGDQNHLDRLPVLHSHSTPNPPILTFTHTQGGGGGGVHVCKILWEELG